LGCAVLINKESDMPSKLRIPKAIPNPRQLSEAQKRALVKLKEWGGWRSSYELGERLDTMRALLDRELVSVRYGRGSFSFPKTGITFKANK
jgi:hypothetical protein